MTRDDPRADDPWAGFTLDPRLPQHAVLRATDRDRSAVLALLSSAYAEGRLDREELDERTSAAQTLKTYGQIAPLVHDLIPQVGPAAGPADLTRWGPREVAAEARRRYDTERRSAVLTFLGPTLICWTIWTAISLGPDGFEMSFPWPLIVMAATLFHLVQVAVQRRERIQHHVRAIERQQAKALRRPRRGQFPI
ncbi:DUF1707 SHOCT-like domain-containing protein [Nocardioides pantholopis]|uniref:DUF1707 SHOCT-like domain-containing protein n=1 Tax=Nocardioides pantholopis TaxID=2483798 RepID=UPI0013E3A367|nr:DUF1707 domain-containing protein [Nocardioides pantholopis]